MGDGHPMMSLGIAYLDCYTLKKKALTYLILYQNSLQDAFEFAVIDLPNRPRKLATSRRVESGMYVRYARRVLRLTMKRARGEYGKEIDLDFRFPSHWLVVTEVPFEDEFYYDEDAKGDPATAVLSFADWERSMAPPSVLEFALRVCQMQCLSFLRATQVHFVTKGCLFDFDAELSDTRNMVLIGDLCPQCKARTVRKLGPEAFQQFAKLTDRAWFGSLRDPDSVVTILKKAFNFDVFVAKGLSPTWYETLRNSIETTGTNEMVRFIISAGLTGLAILLGLKYLIKP